MPWDLWSFMHEPLQLELKATWLSTKTLELTLFLSLNELNATRWDSEQHPVGTDVGYTRTAWGFLVCLLQALPDYSTDGGFQCIFFIKTDCLTALHS